MLSPNQFEAIGKICVLLSIQFRIAIDPTESVLIVLMPPPIDSPPPALTPPEPGLAPLASALLFAGAALSGALGAALSGALDAALADALLRALPSFPGASDTRIVCARAAFLERGVVDCARAVVAGGVDAVVVFANVGWSCAFK